MPQILSWDPEVLRWECADFAVEWPSRALTRFGRWPENNILEPTATRDLDAWLTTKQADGSAISLERGRELAEEFLGRFVPDFAARNFGVQSSCWRSSGQKYGGVESDKAVWYEYIFVQEPLRSSGEIVVTEGRISVSVDPFTSEVARFDRGSRRLEPRIAFTGPLIEEARARQLWDERMQVLVREPQPKLKVIEGPVLSLKVEVSWDEHDIPTGRPIWLITFGTLHITRRAAAPGEEDEGFGLCGEMKIDARSGEVILFRTQ